MIWRLDCGKKSCARPARRTVSIGTSLCSVYVSRSNLYLCKVRSERYSRNCSGLSFSSISNTDTLIRLSRCWRLCFRPRSRSDLQSPRTIQKSSSKQIARFVSAALTATLIRCYTAMSAILVSIWHAMVCKKSPRRTNITATAAGSSA